MVTGVRPPEELALSDDRALVARARAGDTVAFTELLERHDAPMRGVVWQLLRSRDAMDDVLQDAYLKAWRGIASFRGDAKFSSWLYRIVYTTALDHLDSRAGRPEPLRRDHRGAVDDPADAVARSMVLRQALGALPADQLAVVALIDGEGHGYEEVATMLGISAGTVASRLHRARAALRRTLAEGNRT